MMLLEYYKKYGDYAMALARQYWIWGIDLFSVVGMHSLFPLPFYPLCRGRREEFSLLKYSNTYKSLDAQQGTRQP